MKKLAFAAMILISGALSGSAFARTYTIHGTICRPIPANLSAAEYDQFGVHNISNATLTIECPLPLSYHEGGTAPAVTSVQTTVYDRSTTADVGCVLEHVNLNGAVLMSLFNKTFGLGPGTGSVDLPFTPDPGADTSGLWRLRCTIPAVESGAFSHVVSAIVQTAE